MKNKINKKMALKKETLSNLDGTERKALFGGNQAVTMDFNNCTCTLYECAPGQQSDTTGGPGPSAINCTNTCQTCAGDITCNASVCDTCAGKQCGITIDYSECYC